MQSVLLLHPGAMGTSIGKALVDRGFRVVWVSDGRSPATRKRADRSGLTEETSLPAALEYSTVVISVCPPAAAGDIATSVGRLGFRGVFLDANAISPLSARRIAENLQSCGITFVDGGIVGPPAEVSGTTRLYLSGPAASTIATLFEETVVETRYVDDRSGSASAVKVCFAAWTKGTTALLLAIRALAETEGVTSDLLGEWATSFPELVERSERVARSGLKAWRFAPEMEEIAATFETAGLPGAFHQAAAEIYRRMEGFKGAEPSPDLSEVIAALVPNPATPPDRSPSG
jgi:3-hydroxyisobutyrate dehydrogenase-like beta-hydroxyacid dehydrogenase